VIEQATSTTTRLSESTRCRK